MVEVAVTRPLSEDARSTCQHCNAVVWSYKMPPARTVILDDAPGPWLIDRHHRAFLSDRTDGYRVHECTHFARAAIAVSDADFLWP